MIRINVFVFDRRNHQLVRQRYLAKLHYTESSERQRLRRLEAGMCKSCGARPPMSNSARCTYCLLYYAMWRFRRLGLSEDEIDRARIAFEGFDGFCQACGSKGFCGRWCFDHCHKTLKFRGIVGNRCNVILGMVEDNSDVLRKQANYLDHKLPAFTKNRAAPPRESGAT